MTRFYIIILLFDTFAAHLHRETLSRAAVFRKVFVAGDKKLNVEPIETVEINNLYACVDSCLQHDECLSINFSGKFGKCELLDLDQETQQEEDFVVAKFWDYYDTVSKDLCNERSSCYPCGCWSVEFFRSHCRCNNNKLKSKSLTEISPGTSYAVSIHSFVQQYFSLGADIKSIYARMYDATSWSLFATFANNLGKILRIGQDGILYAINENNKSIQHNTANTWSTINLQHTIIDFDVSVQNLYYIANTEKLYVNGVSDELTTILFTRIRVRHDYLYALGKLCKCVMRHKKTDAPNLSDWEIITTNPGSVIEFSVDTNNVIYAIHDDQHIYEWDDYHAKWLRYYDGPCEQFDINGLVMCLTPFKKIMTDNLARLPKPYLHIPFKTFNSSGLYTPFGRGQDVTGAVSTPLKGNQIALDQFGKEKALHTIDGNNFVLASFVSTSITNPNAIDLLGNAIFTISFWTRIMPQKTDICRILTTILNSKYTGIIFEISKDDVSLAIIGTTTFYRLIVPLEMTKLYYWTHFVLVRQGATENTIKLYTNGTELHWTMDNVATTRSKTYPLFISCRNIYMNDLAVWFSELSKDQVLGLYQSDLSNPGWIHKFSRVIEKSCEELKRQRAYTTSGYYWILLDGVMTSVFCDMVTDGGGWTMVTNYNTEIIGNVPPNESQDYTKISTVNTNNFYLSSHGIGALRAHMDIKEIRLECWRSSHGRKVHVVFTLKAVVDLLTHVSDEQQMTCGSYYKLDDDNAVVTKQCAINHINGNLLAPNYGSCRLNLIFDDPYKAAVSLEKQVCDDVNFDPAGIWRYYVR